MIKKMASYIGSQKGSWRIGNQKVVITKQVSNVNLTFKKQDVGSGSWKYPENVTLNGNAVAENSVISVTSGTSCTVALSYISSAYELRIYIDNVLVQSGNGNISYTFSPTSNCEVGVARCTDKI